MFGLFKRKSAAENEKRAQFFYQNCKKEIESYITSCPEPTREDLLKIAVNAKIMQEIFGGARKIQPEAHEFLAPLITNGLAVFISVDGMEEYAALEQMRALIKKNFNQLTENNASDLSLPAINSAFIMSKLVGFEEK